jgi:streptogramin lyase
MLAALARVALGCLAAVAVCVALAAPAAAAPKVDGEFAIPGGVGTDNFIAQGPDGNMWVTTQNGNKVARITPAGDVQEFDSIQSGYGIAAGPDGNLWVSTDAGVVKIPPANPAGATAFDVGLQSGRGIVAGPDGRMWVAGTDELISFDPTDPTGTKDENPVPDGLAAKGMAVGSDGLLWIADNNGRVISATPTLTPTFVPYDIRINNAGGAQDVAGGPNGQVAYAAPQTSPQTVGRITSGGTALKTNLPNGSDPFGVTFAPDGAYWFAFFQANKLLRMTPGGQTSDLTGFSAAAGPRKIATGPDDTLWVTLDNAEKVARITGVEAAPTEPATTLGKKPKKKLRAKDRRNGKRGKAKARFAFSSTAAGAKFECSLRRRGKPPRFKACTSPAKYALKPGKYEFQVRAVLGGEADGTPAKFAFKVVRKKR